MIKTYRRCSQEIWILFRGVNYLSTTLKEEDARKRNYYQQCHGVYISELQWHRNDGQN